MIRRSWWPLAASWLLMTSELVVTTAVIARLADADVNLAAWGVVFAVSTVIQAPAVVLLPTSTALSSDGPTYRRLRRMALAVLGLLTLVHAAIAFTPLYGWVFGDLIGAPPEVVEAARTAFAVMIPWSFGTGYRRFLQGVLIRFGHSRVVIWGTFVRLGSVVALLALAYLTASLAGAVAGAVAIIVGVVGEMGYTRLRAAPVIRDRLLGRPLEGRPMTTPRFLGFFTPLVVTTVLTMVVQMLVTVALGRMPRPLESLAVWPVVYGFLLVWQSLAIAYTEVVISLLGERGAVRALRRFAYALGVATTAGLLVVTATPLARIWFVHVAGLSEPLVDLARNALWLGLPAPALRALHSWFQGLIVFGERTRGILESVVVFLAASGLVLWAGAVWGGSDGIYVGTASFVFGLAVQVAWLERRARPVRRRARDATPEFGRSPP